MHFSVTAEPSAQKITSVNSVEYADCVIYVELCANSVDYADYINYVVIMIIMLA